jgi:hypothetical protein
MKKGQKDSDYEKSNKVESVPVNLSPNAKKFFHQLREKTELLELDIEHLSNMLSDDYKVPYCHINYGGTQPHSVNGRGALSSKVMGSYLYPSMLIKLYMYTAKRKQLRASKATLDTFLHEFVHHLDYTHSKLKLGRSLHTAGFYKRITDLKTKLMG